MHPDRSCSISRIFWSHAEASPRSTAPSTISSGDPIEHIDRGDTANLPP